MGEFQLGPIEARFADLIWQEEPISSGELVRRSEAALGWKKSTTYTVLKRLCKRGIFENRDGIVVSKLSRQEFYARQSEAFVEEHFSGSLPRFLAAFTSRKQLSEAEIQELQRLIDKNRG